MRFFSIFIKFSLLVLLIFFTGLIAGFFYLIFLVISFDLVSCSLFFLDSENYIDEEPLTNFTLENKSNLLKNFFTFFGLACGWYIEWLFLVYKKSLITKEIIVHQDSYLAYLDYLYENFGYTREMVEKAEKIYSFYRDFFILVKDFFTHVWRDFSLFNFFFGETWLDFFFWLIKWFFGPP